MVFNWFLRTDAEGSFSIIIDKNNKRTLGWRVQPKFQIGVDKRDLSILLQLQQNLGGIGSIYSYSNQSPPLAGSKLFNRFN